MAATLIATSHQACAATSPSDFANIWSIVTTKSASDCRIDLPAEVVASTRHQWADVAVFDAFQRPMSFALSWPQPKVAEAETYSLHCRPQDESPEQNSIYRCDLGRVTMGATGLRLRTVDYRPSHTPITLTVRDESGETIGSFSGILDAYANSQELGAPVAFTHMVETGTVEVEFSSPGFKIFDAYLVTRPFSKESLHWHKIDLLQGEKGGKQFFYSLDQSGMRTIALRFVSLPPIAPSTMLTFSACRLSDCSDRSKYNDREGEVYADSLRLGFDSQAYPVSIGNLGRDSSRQYLKVASSSALENPPQLEVGGIYPALVFSAKGSPPYALASGRADLASSTGLRPPDLGIGEAANASLAILVPYSGTARSLGLVAEFTGPGLFLFDLALGLLWASWPLLRKRTRAQGGLRRH